MFDVMQHVRESGDPRYDYIIPGEELYPNMIKEIQAIIKDGATVARARLRAQGLIQEKSPIVRDYLLRALRLPEYAWLLALEAPNPGWEQERLDARKEALECARLWFTELLHYAHTKQILMARSKSNVIDSDTVADAQSAGMPMRIRIEQAPGNIYRWKLNAPIKNPL